MRTIGFPKKGGKRGKKNKKDKAVIRLKPVSKGLRRYATFRSVRCNVFSDCSCASLKAARNPAGSVVFVAWFSIKCDRMACCSRGIKYAPRVTI